MRKRFVLLGMLIIMLALVGCSTTRYDSEYVRDANWTSDGKIVYLVEKKSTWVQKNPIYEQEVKKVTVASLWECDSDGNNKREIGNIVNDWTADLSYYGMSSVGDYVIISTDDNVIPEGVNPNNVISSMYVCRISDGRVVKVGYGLYPSISPDGSQIVYKEWGGGIRMMNIDGSNDHVFLDDTSFTSPQWSPDGEYIAVIRGYAYIDIFNIQGIMKKEFSKYSMDNDSIKYIFQNGYCWDTNDSNSIYTYVYLANINQDKKVKIKFYVESDSIQEEYYNFPGFYYKIKDNKVISYDGDWLVCDIDGSNKWYLYTLLNN